MLLFSVPKENFKTHNDEPDNEETCKNQKKPKTKTARTPRRTPPKRLDYYFKDFRKLCMNLSQENSHLQKTAIFKEFINKLLSQGTYTFWVAYHNKFSIGGGELIELLPLLS